MTHGLEFKGIDKSFPGVHALSEISFTAERGKVLALMGENGAGKSTLLKIMSGDLKADSGSFEIDGVAQSYSSPHDAIESGVSVIYQERQMIPSMSVMENIFAGHLPRKKSGLIDRALLRKNTEEIIKKFGLPIRPETPVSKLSVAYQQMVEIMKAYSRDPQIIAFDEPTASLSDAEITILFDLIRELKKEGKIILYVSHRMAEIFKISDNIVVMKDGHVVTTMQTSESTERQLIAAMVGRDIGDTYANLQRNTEYGDVLLEVKNLSTSKVHNINFSVRKGEIVGLSGLVGSGRTEVVRAIFAADKVTSGEIFFDGKQVKLKSPADAVAAGIALCPEDRKEQGLILHRSVRENTTIPVLSKVKQGLFLKRSIENDLTDEAIKKYSIKTSSMEKKTIELSGGNQQKVILGRWTSSLVNTKLLILDEPTKGIDVKTKGEIYQLVCNLARQGIGVIFISSELTEVINVADRILVMKNGEIAGEIRREDATEENVLALAMTDAEEERGDR